MNNDDEIFGLNEFEGPFWTHDESNEFAPSPDTASGLFKFASKHQSNEHEPHDSDAFSKSVEVVSNALTGILPLFK